MAMPSGRLGVGTGISMAGQRNYAFAVRQAQAYGPGSTVTPSGGGVGPISYRATPSYGGGGGGTFGGSNVTPAASAAFQKAIAMYGPGGGFGKGVEAQLERGRTRSMASGMNVLIGSGLAGTTMAAGLGKKYEEEVAAPTMAGVESQRSQALSSLYASLAGMEQSGFESQAGRSLQSSIAGGQLGLGRSQLAAGEKQAAGQLGLGYAELQARINAQKQPTPTGNNGFRVPTVAPSLFKPTPTPTPTVTPGQKMNLGYSSAELTALNKKLGNVATGF